MTTVKELKEWLSMLPDDADLHIEEQGPQWNIEQCLTIEFPKGNFVPVHIDARVGGNSHDQ